MTDAPSQRSRVRRFPRRAAYDREAVEAILDEGLTCHLGFLDGGQPFVIPMLHARVGDIVYLHGASSSRLVRTVAAGAAVCLTVTLVDGLVLARSAFHHSLNYRSAVVLGHPRVVEPETERLRALEAFVERLVPGRWADVRMPSPQELRATRVLALPLTEASAKLRSGPPADAEPDYELPVWAGLIPLEMRPLAPEPDPRLPPAVAMPHYVSDWRRSPTETTP
jgi:nitroimidazol reductase NimA-like FMN-containing flavoprotein (pyridoxamine 5'-phosphate oxidase superfamily)